MPEDTGLTTARLGFGKVRTKPNREHITHGGTGLNDVIARNPTGVSPRRAAPVHHDLPKSGCCPQTVVMSGDE